MEITLGFLRSQGPVDSIGTARALNDERYADMCEEKESLLLTYTDALNTLLGHLRLQADAISSGELDYGRYDGVIEAAERLRKWAASAYSAHAAYHGCGFPVHLTIDAARGRLNRTSGAGEEGWVPYSYVPAFARCTATEAGAQA